ncbi:hypothetical protein [Streptomyces sp. A1-5]|uniref:hypothetical protein n=1 Tax=Streptomyces sp. A1-5 TaxID=2738410 RepID=UPI001F221736|nr:hypothetical protein [Streptomyces sp. A1-5]UJB43553.1 hypothetical protein HRD51_24595 [Streptomyces sp. A1-5]
MPEMPERTPAASGDYLGRLLARYAPAPPADPFGPPDGADAPGRRTRVRPRLPGPFERVEALRGPAAVEPDDDGRSAPRPSGWPAPSPGVAEPPRAERWSEIRTRHERETVLRTEAAPVADPDRAAADRGPGPAPLLRPTATAVPGPRAAAEGVRPRGRSTAPGGERTAAGRGAPPGGPEAAEPATGVLRPRTDAVPAPRRPAPPRAGSAGGRRGPRGPAERVVHVQIGRLEVSTAGAADSRRPAADARPARPERRAPALSLADYLASQQRTSGGRST